MATIKNTWIEKQKKKKSLETAPSYEIDSKDTWSPVEMDKAPKRYSTASRAMYKHTLRGVRK